MNEPDEMRRGTILHADLDAFYASVEQLLDPSLRGKPIAVGGGVVLAASYEAKAFGVRGGMSGRRARELCPQLQFVGGNFKEYQRLGDAAIKVLGDFTPLVERLSIDEAFADVAGCERLFGPPVEIAKEIRRRVRVELGLPISVGVARTKHLAKIASQVAKPDGLVVVDPSSRARFPPRLAGRADVGRRPRHQGAAGRCRCGHDRTVGARSAMAAREPSWARVGPKALGAGVEPRSARDQDAAAVALGRSPVCAWQKARRGADHSADTPPPCRQDRHPASRQIATGTDGDGARALCGYALGHPLGNAAGANFGNENARRGRRNIGPCGVGRSPAREDYLVAGNFSFEPGGASDPAARAADWIGG